MSCCGGKHIFMIPVTQVEDEVANRIKVSNEENREVVWLEHLVGGALKTYTTSDGQKYSAGGKYRFIEAYKEHAEELLKMRKLGRNIFRISQNNFPEINLTTEDIEDDSTQEIVIDVSELTEGDVVVFEDGSTLEVLEVFEEDNSEYLLQDAVDILDSVIEQIEESNEDVIEKTVTSKRKKK